MHADKRRSSGRMSGDTEHALRLGLVFYYGILCATCRPLPAQRRRVADHLLVARLVWPADLEDEAPGMLAKESLIRLSKVTFIALAAYMPPP
jgi:hypothetical protein